jgi:hypothetical protein
MFIIVATDRASRRPIFAKSVDGEIRFASGMAVNRGSDEDHPGGFYRRDQAQQFTGEEAMRLVLKMVAHGGRSWVVFPQIVLATDPLIERFEA